MTLMADAISNVPTHQPNGKFAPGHQLSKGRGNPHAKRVLHNRSVFFRCVTDDDVKRAYRQLMLKVRKGDMQAIKEFLDRAIGKTTDEQTKDDQAKVIQMFLTQVNQTLIQAGAPAKQIDSVTTSTNAGARAEASANDANAGAPMHTHDAQSDVNPASDHT